MAGQLAASQEGLSSVRKYYVTNFSGFAAKVVRQIQLWFDCGSCDINNYEKIMHLVPLLTGAGFVLTMSENLCNVHSSAQFLLSTIS
jgi:hypothetical protein